MSLAVSARKAIVWGAGFTFVRDLFQFVGTITLARLLTPEDYGRAALALSIQSVVSAASFKSIILHVLQVRDPAQIDWQSQFTGGLLINMIAAIALLTIGEVVAFYPTYATVAPLVSALSITMLTDLFGALRFTMVQTQHDWVRYRALLLAGAVLALIVSIVSALLGAGAWALLAGTVLLNIPAIIDLLLIEGWRPTFEMRFDNYLRSVKFGLNRAVSSLTTIGRQAAENSAIAALNGFGQLGQFTRSFGLSTMLAGRIGPISTQTLYPVLTRAEAKTAHFRRGASLLLSGITWMTVPAVVFLASNATDIVLILYGSKWSTISLLIPLVSLVVGLSGLTQSILQLLLANDCPGLSLRLEVAGAIASFILLIVVLPHGIETYLRFYAGLSFVSLIAALMALRLTNGISASAVMFAFWPPVVAATAAYVSVSFFSTLGFGAAHQGLVKIFLVLIGKGIIFSASFIATLALAFPRSLGDLLSEMPGGRKVANLLQLRTINREYEE